MRSVGFALILTAWTGVASAAETTAPSETPPPLEAVPTPVCTTLLPESGPDFQIRAGAGFYYIRPAWSANPAFATFGTLGNATTASGTLSSIKYDYAFSPRLWLGVAVVDSVGGRVRYWSFDQSDPVLVRDNSDSIFTTAAPLGVGFATQGSATNPGVLMVQSRLRLNAIDGEITKDLAIGRMEILWAGGVRYAHLTQNYGAGELMANGATQALTSGNRLDGFGPTFAIEARYPTIGGIILYDNVRASLLYGTGSQSAFSQTISNGNLAMTADRNALLPIGELEIGGEYRRNVGPGTIFVNMALVGQLWFGAGNSSLSDGSSSLALVPVAIPSPIAASYANLGFFGLSVTTGVNW